MLRKRGSRTLSHGSRTRLKGLFGDGIWQCDCKPRVPAERFKVKKEGPNQNRWFYTCQRPEPDRCRFFLWESDAKAREEGAVLNNSRTEPLPADVALVGAQSREAISPPSPSESPETLTEWDRPVLKALEGSNPVSDGNSLSMSSGDEEALNQAANIVPETPRRAARTDVFTTPGKRKLSEMMVGGLPTPNTNRKPLFGPQSAASNRIADDFLNLVSPQTTPTPARFRDALPGSNSSDGIFSDISETLIACNVSLNDGAKTAVERVCNRYALKNRGIVQARDITRKALIAKGSKVAELEHRIKTLEAELETERAIVSYLRSDSARVGPD